MARKIGDINAKLAYYTSTKSGPLLKVQHPLYLTEKFMPGKKGVKSSIVCQDELAMFFDCVKKSDYKNELCQKEFSKFLQCDQKFKESKVKSKEKTDQKGAGVGKVNRATKANNLLKRFPNSVSKLATIAQRNMYITDKVQQRKPMPYGRNRR